MPRFVILEHDHPVLHWDLMLEAAGVLQTWRLAETPAPGRTIAATALGDHRIAYLEYEGPVSHDRGNVLRWDAGVYEEQPDSLPTARRLEFHGVRVHGPIRVEHLSGSDWHFTWEE